MFYKPILYPNDFWLLRSQFFEINTTTPQLPLQVTFQPMSYWKFQIFATMTQGFDEAAKQQGSAGGAELDEIKRMLVETNPYFLGLTALVSVLHMVYVFLAHQLSLRTDAAESLQVRDARFQLGCVALETETGARWCIRTVSLSICLLVSHSLIRGSIS